MAITSELAFTYAALILHEDGILISAEKINIIMKIDSYWSPLFTKLLEQRIIDLEVAVSLLPLRLSSMATTVKDVAVSVASTLYAKVAGKEEVIHSSDTHDQVEELKEGDGEKKRSYTKKLSSTTMAAKDTVVSASSTVYEKVAGFGSTVMEQPDVGTEQDKVVLMREYLAEKLRPGEVEDEADGLAGLAMWVLRHDGVMLVGQESSAEWTQAWSHTVNFSLYREWL